MIAAQPNKAAQERLIAKLMEMPNSAVRNEFVLWDCDSGCISSGTA